MLSLQLLSDSFKDYTLPNTTIRGYVKEYESSPKTLMILKGFKGSRVPGFE